MVEWSLDRALSEQVGGRVFEVCGPSAFISWLLHLVRGGMAPGQGAVGVC